MTLSIEMKKSLVFIAVCAGFVKSCWNPHQMPKKGVEKENIIIAFMKKYRYNKTMVVQSGAKWFINPQSERQVAENANRRICSQLRCEGPRQFSCQNARTLGGTLYSYQRP